MSLLLALPLGGLASRPGAAAAKTPPSSSTTFRKGSYIIDLGVNTLSKPDGLQPYGLLYRLLVDLHVPVYWVIKDGKAGGPGNGSTGLAPATVDFSASVVRDGAATPNTAPVVSRNYTTGAFVIAQEYIDASVDAAVHAFAATTVVDKADAAFSAPVYKALMYWPKAVLDAQNGKLAQAYYANAGIPETTSSYIWKDPSQLNACDDIYVMPHADPTWATHSNLKTFNNNGGYIWAGCHAVSVLENLANPSDPNDRMNFLTTNGLLRFDQHKAGSPPYSYETDGSDPVLQIGGILDAATQNGSEQIFMPSVGSAWRPSTVNVVWDATQQDVEANKSPGEARVLTYGPGFGIPTNGLVMYEAGHSLDKGTVGDVPAQRAFFNFLLMGGLQHAPTVAVNQPPSPMVSGSTVTLTATATGGAPGYSYHWVSTCTDASFGKPTGFLETSGGEITTTFTAPQASTKTTCAIQLLVTDRCGHQPFGATTVEVSPAADLAVAKSVSAPQVSKNSTFTFTVTVTNIGPGMATAPTVTDTLPAAADADYVSASPAPATHVGSTLTWTLADLGAGATSTITVTMKALTPGATLLNNVTVTSSTPDTNLSNNSASAHTRVLNAGVWIEKVARPEFISNHGTVTFEFVVHNVGTDPLSHVVVTDNPACTTMTGPTGDLNGDGVLAPPLGAVPTEIWRYTCTRALVAGPPPPGGSGTPDVAVSSGGFSENVPAVDGSDYTKQDVVQATALDPLGNTVHNVAATVVTIANPAIKVTKVLSPTGQHPTAGGMATFLVTVTNTGNVPLVNVDTQDTWVGSCDTATVPDLPAAKSFAMTCTATVPVGATSPAANTVTATAHDLLGTAVTDTATASVTLGTPALTITKTASTAGPVHDGSTFTYTVTVQNTNAVAQTGVTVYDNLPSGLSLNGPVTAALSSYPITATDDFGTTNTKSYTTGSGWASGTAGWSEVLGETTDPGAGHIQIDTGKGHPKNSLLFNPDNKQYAIQRAVDLTAATSGTLTFECTRENHNSADDALTVYVNGTSVVVIDQNYPATGTSDFCPTSNGSSWGTITVTLPPSALGTVANVKLLVGGDKNFNVDNVTVTAHVPDTTFTAGNPPTLTSTGGPYTLAAANGGAGGTVTFTIPVVVTGAPADGYQFSNTATATSDQHTDPVSASVITPYAAPRFSITKTAIETWVNVSGTVVYRVELRNTGNVALHEVTVTDPDCGTTPVYVQGDLNSDHWLQAGEIWRYTCTRLAEKTSSPPNPGVLPNTATAHMKDAFGQDVTPQSASAEVRVIHPQIAITATPVTAVVTLGGTVAYTYRVTNPGDIALLDSPPTAANCSPLVYRTGDGNANGWLDPGEEWVYDCTTSALTANLINQSISVTGHDLIFGSSVTAATQVSVYVTPAMQLVKTASDAPSGANGSTISVGTGNIVTYHYSLTNPQSTPAVGLPLDVAVTDDRCTPVTAVKVSGVIVGDTSPTNGLLDPGETWSLRCSAGTLGDTTINTAQASGSYAIAGVTGSVSSNQATATVTVLRPQLVLSKSANSEVVRIGAPVTYTFGVANVGATTFSLANLGAAADKVATQEGTVTTVDACGPLVGPHFPADSAHDVNGNGELDPGDHLTYMCSTALATDTHDAFTMGLSTDHLGTSYQPIPAYDTAFVIDPEFTITKVATTSLAGPGTDIEGEAGKPVTYTISVHHSLAASGTFKDSLNALSLLVSDPLCATYESVSGDTDANGLLNPGETWIYTCLLAALPDGDPTHNTVTGDATITSRELNPDSTPANPDDGLAPMTHTASATVTPRGLAITVVKRSLHCDVGVPSCDLPGAQFSLYAADPAGPTPGPAMPLTADPSGVTFTSGLLAVNHDYWLVETKAPAGFQLLARPGRLNLTRTALTLKDTSSGGVITVDAPAFRVSVADVAAGALPTVGGAGALPHLAVGLVLLAVGFLGYRRAFGVRQ